MTAIDKYLAPQAAALTLRQKRMEILSSNIANAATPNFKARDIDFEGAFQQAMTGVDKLTTTNTIHMTATSGGQNPETLYRMPLSQSLDGNTVELHVEQLKFAENATRYEASLQFLNDRIRGLRSALRGE
jgi:flagellar basal-body rod protein FlgB